MTFSEKLIHLRREAGLSQEQLADKLKVTRQSVSKWESGITMPELSKLVALSELFNVSVDYLVKDGIESEKKAGKNADTGRLEQRLDDLAGEYHRSFGPYFSYTSRVKLFGLPLVSVRFGRDRHPTKHTAAVGVIAVGNFAVGVVSIGMLSAGLLSLGMIAFGGLAVGMCAIGWRPLGLAALGAL